MVSIWQSVDSCGDLSTLQQQDIRNILVVCGTGVATSTVVVKKVKDFCALKGFDVSITQTAVTELLRAEITADFIIATTQVPDKITVPVVAGLPFLTGMGLQATYDQIEALINA